MRSKVFDSNPSNLSKYKYSFNHKLFELNLSSSVDNRVNLPLTNTSKTNSTLPNKIKSGAKFSLEKITVEEPIIEDTKTPKLKKTKDYFKLPTLKNKQINPESPTKQTLLPHPYYQARVFKAHHSKQNSYLTNLAKQHFIQCIEALRIGKTLKQSQPQKEIKLHKKHPKHKTIYLDMDETLIHCDQTSNNYTVKLNFPIEGGGTIAAGIRIRPFCDEFLRELSTFSEVIIFTASSASYADVVLDHIDPAKKYISHRLYRQHCTLEKQFFVKDLRVINRRLEDCLIVDNSAFSFMMQPENGVPILPFYHLAKDRQLVALLEFLKRAVQYVDMRDAVKETFFWSKYLSVDHDPRKVFLNEFSKTL